MKDTDRIEFVDVAKGITILLVVLGHTLSWSLPEEKYWRDFIYSFHMPLFFMLSALTSKTITEGNELLKKLEKSFLKLVLPVIVYFVIVSITTIVNSSGEISKTEYIAKQINSFIFANGVNVRVLNSTIPALGIVWFMIALFFAKNIFNYICFKISSPVFRCIISLVLGIGGMIIGHFQWLPFALDLVLQIMPFLYLGSILKNIDFNKHTIIKMLLFGIAWIGIFWIYHSKTNSYYDLSWRWHPLYPLSDIGAACGSLFIIFLSVLLSRFKLSTPLKFLGKYTFTFFWVHVFDYLYSNIWKSTDNVLINYLLRIALDIAIFCIIQFAYKFIKNAIVKKKRHSLDNQK